MAGARAERQKLVKKLEKQGFSVIRTGSGHWRVAAPDGGSFVIMAYSPRSPASHDTIKRLQQIGYRP